MQTHTEMHDLWERTHVFLYRGAVLLEKHVLIDCYIYIISFSLLQCYTLLKEMLLGSPACFPSCTKIGGLATAQHTTHLQSVLGVQLGQDMNKNNGDIARLPVSRSISTA